MPRKVPGPVPGASVLVEPVGFEPVRVYFRAPTHLEKRAFFDAQVHKLKIGASTTEVTMSMATVFERRDALLKQWVTHVEEYETPAGVPIKTADELCEHGEEELLVEVQDAIEAALSLIEQSKKNLDSSSGSSEAATQASGGTPCRRGNVSPMPQGLAER
jgi:hypothetical protein